MKYAGAIKRLLAFLIDLTVLLTLYFFLALILGISIISQQLFALPLLGLWFYGGLFCTAWLYCALLESSPWQATIGKKFFNLQVVNLNGERIGFFRASVRHLSKMFSRMIAFAGLFMIFFTKKKQALHDKIASTLVIEKQSVSVIRN